MSAGRTVTACTSSGNCLTATITANDVRLENTGTPGEVTATREEWAVFVAAIKAGKFDPPTGRE